MRLLIDDKKDIDADIVARTIDEGLQLLDDHDRDELLIDSYFENDYRCGFDVVKEANKKGRLPRIVTMVSDCRFFSNSD